MNRRLSTLLILIALISTMSLAEEPKIEYVASFGGKILDSLTYDGRLYVAQGDCIRILDIHDKNRIRELGSIREKKRVIEQLGIRWPVVFYMTRWQGGIWYHVNGVDVSDPVHPLVLQDIDLPFMKLDPNWAIRDSFLVFREMERIYDISNPLKPVRLGDSGMSESEKNRLLDSLTTRVMAREIPAIPSKIIYSGSIQLVKAVGAFVYAVDAEKDLKAIDVSRPENPKYAGVPDDSNKIRARIMAGQPVRIKERIARKSYRITITDVDEDYLSEKRIVLERVSDDSTTDTPVCLMKIPPTEGEPPNQLDEVWLLDDYLIVFENMHNTTTSIDCMTVLDLKDPKNPKKLGKYGGYSSIGLDGFEKVPKGISILGNMIYVADGEKRAGDLAYDRAGRRGPERETIIDFTQSLPMDSLVKHTRFILSALDD